VSKRARELEDALAEAKETQDWLQAAVAEERAAREDAERKAAQTAESARQLLRKVSPENIVAAVQRFLSAVVAAEDYEQTRSQWAARQVRVMGIRRQLDADGRMWHIATLNAGSAAGTRTGLFLEVTVGTQPLMTVA
jgi:septation ring formation regulator EzrA